MDSTNLRRALVHQPSKQVQVASLLTTISIAFILLWLPAESLIASPHSLPLEFTASAEVEPDVLGSGIGRFNSITCADVDDDGRDEILFGSYEGHVVSVEYLNGEYNEDRISARFGTRTWGITTGQFDNDSAVEIIIGDGDGRVRSIDGSSKKIEWESKEVVRDAHGLLLHDMDDDGHNELLVGTGFKTDQNWGQIFIFRQGQRDYYDAFDPFDSRLRELDVADVDNDGREELVVCSGVSLGDVGGEGYVRVFDLETKELEWKSPDLGGCVEGLKVMDLDGDNTLEIVVTNGYRYLEGYCYIYHHNNKSDEYERVWKSDNIGPKAYGLDVGDIDDDGVMEIVIGNLAGYIHVFNGVTHEREWISNNLGRDILGITLGDPDGDGDVEIIDGQGGYVGKGDYTSGYVTPHIYVIDGKSHEIEAVLGEIDTTKQWAQVGILVMAVVALAEIGIIARIKTRKRDSR